MYVNEYQALAARTLIDGPDRTYTPEELFLIYKGLHLMRDVGVVMDILKKGIFHQHGIDLERFDTALDDVEVSLRGIQNRWWKDERIEKLTPQNIMMMWNTFGIYGEGGEVADIILESVLTGDPMDMPHLKKELGDVSWYVFADATTAGITMDDVLRENIEKLQKRYPNGYSSTASINRKVENE